MPVAEIEQTPDGYQICPACGHHTSAYAGSCTVFVLHEHGAFPTYCGCDCVVAMGGKSFADTLAEALWGSEPGGEAE